jgi:Gpi18-like mannosyltransferase
VLLLVGLVVRLWAMRFPPLPSDMSAWIAWGERVYAVGPRNFYDPTIFTDYAPGYLYVLWLLAAIKNTFFAGANVGVDHVLYRLPAIVCDLLTAALIFNVLQRELQRNAPTFQRSNVPTLALPLIGAAVHLFNPLVIFNGAAWGQIDGVFTFAMLLALVLALRNYPVAAVLSYVAAFLIKPQAISLAPVLAIVLLMRYPWRRWLPAGVAGVVLGFVLIAPFLGLSSYVALVRLLSSSVEVYPYTSLFTYNLWGMFGFWEDDRVASFLGISLRSLGTLLYLVGIGYGAWLFVRALRRSADPVFAGFASATYFVFLPVMVLTRMHERYLYPLFPFLLVFALLCLLRRQVSGVGGRETQQSTNLQAQPPFLAWLPLGLYVALSVLHTFNLYQVYVYYLFYARDAQVPASHWLYYFVEPRGALWSLLTVMMFVLVAVSLPWWNGTQGNRRGVREASLARETT